MTSKKLSDQEKDLYMVYVSKGNELFGGADGPSQRDMEKSPLPRVCISRKYGFLRQTDWVHTLAHYLQAIGT